MTSITQLSASTIEAIKNYAYALTDENGRVFYVGTGLGRRVFAHVNEVRELLLKGASLSDESADADDTETTARFDLTGPKSHVRAPALAYAKPGHAAHPNVADPERSSTSETDRAPCLVETRLH